MSNIQEEKSIFYLLIHSFVLLPTVEALWRSMLEIWYKYARKKNKIKKLTPTTTQQLHKHLLESLYIIHLIKCNG